MTKFVIALLTWAALIFVLAIIGGFLVQTVAGYFGYDLTLWQGWVTAFTISWCFGSKVSTSS